MSFEYWLMLAAMAGLGWGVFGPDDEVVFRAVAKWPSKGFDRMLTGQHGGLLVEVFDPPWWRLNRWAWWAFRAGKKAKTESLVISEGRTHVVRATVADLGAPKRRFRGRRLG